MNFLKAQEKVEQEADKNENQPQTSASEQTTQDSTETTTAPNGDVGGNTDEDKDNNSGSKVGGIISDENLKDITSDSTNKGESSSSDSKVGPGQIMSIIQSVRKDLQNVGKSIQGKSDGSEPVGSNTFKAAYDVYSKHKDNKPHQYVAETPQRDGASAVAEVPSDEEIKIVKRFFNNDEFYDSDLLEAYKNLDSIQFTYTEEATELDPTQDTETMHTGLKAQDLQSQPELSAAVKEDPESGYLMVDTRELTMSNAAAISDICKKLEEIEKKINYLGG